eukprot:TRINITY_DN57800_c0_g1_i1.p1 TRINITY_DN57800_c0_g1~~TRINITY_DN57800_c0_g1_i1.p1  ORF type:complete len:703 (+),score=218.59 TRINITY_DN57800_c0_g1_i1:77-2185(+)
MKAVSRILVASLFGLATAITYSGKGGGLSLDLSSAPESPVKKILTFLSDLRDEAIAEKAAEAAAYAGYKAWCNATIVETTKDISDNNETLSAANLEIERLSGTLATALSEIKYAKKQLAENKDRRQEATAIRQQEIKEYVNATDDLESAIKGLTEVTKALGGNTSSQGSFLAVSNSRTERASVLLQKVLRSSNHLTEKLSEENLELLQSYVGGPVAYENQNSGVAGVVSQTLTDLKEDLKLANDQEAAKKKAFSTLVASLDSENAQLTKSVNDYTTANAEDLDKYNTNKELKDDTEAELASNEKLLQEAQLQCTVKAENFLSRRELREQEIAGVNKSIEILSGENATSTFKSSAQVSFIQMSSSSAQRAVRKQAYSSLKALASEHNAVSLAQIASDLNSGGAFRSIILRIEEQIEFLRAEEKEDLEHREKCQEQQSQNEAELATLTDSIKKSGTKIERLDLEKKELETSAAQLTAAMNETKKEMANRSSLRQIEHDDFVAAHKQDVAALALLKTAKDSITKFYVKNNKKVSALLRKKKKAHIFVAKSASKKAPPAPDAGFESGDYSGKKDATKTLVTLFDMVIDDLAKEIKDSETGDADGQKEFEDEIRSMTDVYDSKEEKKIATEKRIAATQEALANEKGDKDEATSDKKDATTQKAALATDCDWVQTKFASRREKRKAEIEGLVEAKGMLTTVKEGYAPS